VPSHAELLETLARWRRFPGMERLEPGEGRIALTFDDGPDPDATPAVLDALDEAGARATFFLVGEQVEAHPELARAVAERGHTVGVHGHRHVEHDELADPEGDLAAVLAAVGAPAQLMRPPYGRFSESSYAAGLRHGLTPVYWSGWGCDWEEIPAARIAELVVRDMAPGGIVLLHDSARYAYRATAQPTAEALHVVLAAARERGLVPVAL
jgi:peptidoglycan/xylan/chitin deacetylase (PgdA/CDA1 family)